MKITNFNEPKPDGLICHKLATGRNGPDQRSEDFCGLQRTRFLWKKRPRRAVSFRNCRLSDCFSNGAGDRDRTGIPSLEG